MAKKASKSNVRYKSMKSTTKKSVSSRRKKNNRWNGFRNISRSRIYVFVLIFGVIGSVMLFRSFAATPNATAKMGVYRGSERPDAVAGYETWAGRPVTYALDFIGKANPVDNVWKNIDNPSSRCSSWAPSKYSMVLSTGMVPSSSHSLAAGARGEYNAHWKSFGTTLVNGGCADTILRLGWEFNGKFYNWSAGGQEAEYAAYWRQIVTTLRAVPGQSFRFDWCPLAGNANANVEAAYPGDQYVDIIGLDAYDTSSVHTSDSNRWNDQVNRVYGLKWQKDFAVKHGKSVSFPEWGLTVRPNDNLGGGDNPYYIQKMYDWMNALPASGGGALAYHSYFEYDAADASHRLMLGQFPKSATMFQKLFGVLPSSTVVDTTPPSNPTNLVAVTVSQTQIDLSWQASSDNVGTTAYDVYRGSTRVASSTGTSFSDSGLAAGTAYSYYIIAWDAAGNRSSASSSVSATTKTATTATPVVVPVSLPFRMRSGSTSSYTDPAGVRWSPEQFYATNVSSGLGSTATGIGNTDKDPLYQSERWGISSYSIPVANGTYTLRLHFAEINPTSGSRVFDVNAEGQALLTSYNISAVAGDFTAAVKEFTVTVDDGVLNVGFAKIQNATKLSGLELFEPVPPPALSLKTSSYSATVSKYRSKTFSLTLPKAGTIKYAVNSPGSGRYDVEVYDANGVKVAERLNATTQFSDIFTIAKPGTYKLKVTTKWWSSNTFTLNVTYPN